MRRSLHTNSLTGTIPDLSKMQKLTNLYASLGFGSHLMLFFCGQVAARQSIAWPGPILTRSQ